MQSSIWFEKYKPQTLDDLILPESFKEKLRTYIANRSLPNLGLWSTLPGLGKSSTANVIINELGADAIWINASMERGIDVIRSKIKTFAERASFDGNLKIVVLDESDNLLPDFQSAFRGFSDEYSTNCRFIFTGNYKNKMIQPLLDRLENYDYSDFKQEDIIQQLVVRCANILKSESVSFEKQDLAQVIKSQYPKIRSIIGYLQRFSKDCHLSINDSALNDEIDQVFNILKTKNFDKIYTFVNNLNQPDSVFSYFYENIDFFKGINQAKAIVILAKYQDMSERARDKYLNTMACFVELLQCLD